MPTNAKPGVTKTVAAADMSTPAAFAKLARAKLYAAAADADADTNAMPPSDFDLNPVAGEPIAATTLRAAAVLVAIVARDPLTVLLTERPPHLTAHGGQIAFPGGKIDASDASALAAACREANEEIGLPTAAIDVLGYLPPYSTATGYRITPVVAMVTPPLDLRADPAEVADIFEVPLAFLMSDQNHHIDSRTWLGEPRQFYAMPYEQRYIWGATAGILKSLHRSLTHE